MVKRRIAWVISKWYSDKDVPATGGVIWEILRYLIQDQGEASDLVVRITAAIALGDCVDVRCLNLLSEGYNHSHDLCTCVLEPRF